MTKISQTACGLAKLMPVSTQVSVSESASTIEIILLVLLKHSLKFRCTNFGLRIRLQAFPSCFVETFQILDKLIPASPPFKPSS